MNNEISNRKISVIVPVYNAEKYLEQCLESIKNQSYQNFEVILVNDDSTDNSESICKNFLKWKIILYILYLEFNRLAYI